MAAFHREHLVELASTAEDPFNGAAVDMNGLGDKLVRGGLTA